MTCVGQLNPHHSLQGRVWVCFVLVLIVIVWSFYEFLDRVLFHHESCDYYCDIPGHFVLLNYMFRLSSSANTLLPGCFHPWTFLLHSGLNMLLSDSFMSCLYSLLGYWTGALQLIVLVVIDAVNCPFATCILVHILEIKLERIMGL